MSDRQEIADAVNTITGLNCTPYFRQTTKPGEAMVRLSSMERTSNGFGMLKTWQVWIVLPQSNEAAEKWIDDNHDSIYAALKRVLPLTNVLPSELVIGSATTNGIIYEGIR